jgi:hypothetical protein
MPLATDSLHICDGCLCTVLCTTGDLKRRWGWKQHRGTDEDGKAWELLLCPECQPQEAT